jgi:hypothetical protein
MGTSRSGTTLTGEILGQVPGLTYAGEVRWLWDQVATSGLCGCGRTVSECDAWRSAVKSDTDPSATAERARSTARLGDRAVGRRHSWIRALGLLVRARARRPLDPDAVDYGAELASVYAALARETGCEWVVDTSGEASDAILIAQLPDVDLRLVHIVRDPRGVVSSHLRAGGRSSGDVARVTYFAVAWLMSNLAASLVRRQLSPATTVRVRYEDLVSEPEPTLATVLGLVDRSLPPGLVADGHVELAPTHSAAGNPKRFRQGSVELREDTSWHTDLSRVDRALVRLLTLPMARHYGYGGR